MKDLLKLAYGLVVVVVTRWRASRWSPAAWRRYQLRRGASMLGFARRRCRYWAELAGSLSNREWQQLPVSEKADLWARFSETHPAGIPREEAEQVALDAERTRDFRSRVGGLTVGLSSGTSGHRSLFLVSPLEQVGWAALMYSRLIGRISFQPRRIAFFLRSNSNLYEEMRTRFVTFEYFDLALSDEEVDRRLRALDPDILVGPPAVLARLASRKARGVLAIAPTLVVSGAEVLEPQERARIESAFGVVVREVYQCTEGTIAVSCADGHLHLQEDLVHVALEPVAPKGDGDGDRRVNPVVTMLHRRAQPFLRYRMNDVLVMADDGHRCACGSSFRVIKRIEGRRDDVLELPSSSGEATRAVYPDTLRQAILQADGVDEYRVHQTGDAALTVFVESSADPDRVRTSVVSSVVGALARCDAAVDQVDVVFGLPPERVEDKVRRVRRLPHPAPPAQAPAWLQTPSSHAQRAIEAP